MSKEQKMINMLNDVWMKMDTTDEYGEPSDTSSYEEAIEYAKNAISKQEELKKEIARLRNQRSFAIGDNEREAELLEHFVVEPEPKTLADVDIMCEGEIMVEDDYINFSWDCWFDVDKMFGTDTRDDDDMWVNFYTNWYPDGSVKAIYIVKSNTGDKAYEYALSEKEKKFLLEKMDDYCVWHTDGLSLEDFWEECQKEEEEKDEV